MLQLVNINKNYNPGSVNELCLFKDFNFTVKVAVSPMFLSWVIGFGSKAKVLYPQSVAEQCRQLCLEAMSQY